MTKQPLTIEHALLGFRREQPMHAYEIHQKLMHNQALGRHGLFAYYFVNRTALAELRSRILGPLDQLA